MSMITKYPEIASVLHNLIEYPEVASILHDSPDPDYHLTICAILHT